VINVDGNPAYPKVVAELKQEGKLGRRLSIAAKNGAILAGEKEPWCGLRNGLL
jgi:hypothetical protein